MIIIAVVVYKINVHHLFLLNSILIAFELGQIDNNREVHLLLRFSLEQRPSGLRGEGVRLQMVLQPHNSWETVKRAECRARVHAIYPKNPLLEPGPGHQNSSAQKVLKSSLWISLLMTSSLAHLPKHWEWKFQQ